MLGTKLRNYYIKNQYSDYIFFLKNYIIGRYVKGLTLARKQHKEKDYYCFINVKYAIEFYYFHYDTQGSDSIRKWWVQREIFDRVFKELRVELSSESVRKLPRMQLFIGRENKDILRKYLGHLKEFENIAQ